MASTSSSSSFQRNWLTDLVGLALLIGVFYALWLGSYPLFTPDEGRYSDVAREMAASGDYITPRVNGVVFLDKPVLYYWLQAAAIHLFGLSEWALRFFPALFGVMGCLITYASGRQLFNRRTGLLSAILLAASPLYFGGAHYANLDLEVAVLISGSLLCFLTAVQQTNHPRTLLLMAAYVFAALAILTKGLIGLVFPGLIIGAWLLLLNRWRLLAQIHLPLGILLIALIVTPWYVLVQRANPAFLHYFFVTQHVTRFLSGAVFNNAMPVWFYLPIVLIGMFPWTIFLIQTMYFHLKQIFQARQQHAAELFLLLWAVIIFGFFSTPHSKIVSYILPVLPALALLIGYYLANLWDNKNTWGLFTAKILLILCSALAAAALVIVSQRADIHVPINFTPFLTVFAGIFAFTAMIAVWLLVRRAHLAALVITCLFSSCLTLLTLVISAQHLNQDSTKALVTQLKNIRQPQDIVVNYFKFYQDMPIYLGQRVLIVANWSAPGIAKKDNWVREFWNGKSLQNADDILISEDVFWQKWHGKDRVFVFLNDNYLDQFKSHTQKFTVISQDKETLLLSNQP